MDEAERCHRLAILNEGVLVALDSPEALKSRVGGDVIVLRTQDQAIEPVYWQPIWCTTAIMDNTVRIERPKGHEFITDLVEAFPGQIDAVTLSNRVWRTCFIHMTGQDFWAKTG